MVKQSALDWRLRGGPGPLPRSAGKLVVMEAFEWESPQAERADKTTVLTVFRAAACEHLAEPALKATAG